MSNEPQKKSQTHKPVVTYIMILFIAAFLLMALSFLMHQRSNTEALGQLQSSMTAMQEVQATQEKNIELQEQLSELQDQLDKTVAAYDGQLTALVGDVENAQLALDALSNLYLLQQAYAAGEYEVCQQIIQLMEQTQQVGALATELDAGDAALSETLVSPSERFDQLKDAVTTLLEQADPAKSE